MVEIVCARFRNGAKEYYFDPKGRRFEAGQYMVVDTAQGIEYVLCTRGNHRVPDQNVPRPLRGVIRLATENDRRNAAANRRREKEAVEICEKKIAAHQLEMKLARVECSFDGNKMIFFFTAEGRVDFRELVRDLASVFHTRIEMRQIGVRDEAKLLGGLGICGQPLCCNRFFSEFIPVSIKMAKTQNLPLNPTKISGNCGRLLCCLKYEQSAYEDAMKRLPKLESFVDTPDGLGNICGVDVLREQLQVRLDSAPEVPRNYHPSEIRVLRSGRGSRAGIEIPKEHPARYKPEEEAPKPRIGMGNLSAAPEKEPKEPKESKGPRDTQDIKDIKNIKGAKETKGTRETEEQPRRRNYGNYGNYGNKEYKDSKDYKKIRPRERSDRYDLYDGDSPNEACVARRQGTKVPLRFSVSPTREKKPTDYTAGKNRRKTNRPKRGRP